MYSNYRNRGRSSSYGNSASRSNSSASSSSYYNSIRRPYFRSRRPGGFRRSIPRLDIAKFINKAVEQTEENLYTAKHTFSDFSFNERLLLNISKKGYLSPTEIQDHAIKPIMEGKDFLGIAETGSGKTAAFLLPIIDKILKNKSEKALIIVPTRELAEQIEKEFRIFAAGLGIYSVLCIGGVNIRPQIINLRRGFNIVIGTPGRIKDLVEHKNIDLSKFNTLVLDEVDRMLDMGFIPDVKFLINLMPKSRQTLFFSATTDRKVEFLMDTFLKDPTKLFLKKRDTGSYIEQNIVKYLREEEKVELLHNILISEGVKKVLIFSQTKMGVDRLLRELRLKGFNIDAIHGDKSQFVRQKVINKYRTNIINILIATDVAARGLDISDITHVINYDTPETYDSYIHRIGRTGRNKQKGYALTFVKAFGY